MKGWCRNIIVKKIWKNFQLFVLKVKEYFNAYVIHIQTNTKIIINAKILIIL